MTAANNMNSQQQQMYEADIRVRRSQEWCVYVCVWWWKRIIKIWVYNVYTTMYQDVFQSKFLQCCPHMAAATYKDELKGTATRHNDANSLPGVYYMQRH